MNKEKINIPEEVRQSTENVVKKGSEENGKLEQQKAAIEAVRAKIEVALNSEPQKPLPVAEISSLIEATEELMNYNDDIYKILEPFLKDKNVLDIFCGTSRSKQYFKENNITDNVTTFDKRSGVADITGNVAEIEKYMPIKKQFDCIFSFGADPGFADYEKIENLLSDQGLFITSSTDTMFNEIELPVILGIDSNKKEDDNSDIFVQETQKKLSHFVPALIIKVNDIRSWFGKQRTPELKVNKVYILWKKR